MRQDIDDRERSTTRRVNTEDLPQPQWDCAETMHPWVMVWSRAATGWGANVDAEERMWECGRDGCTRWRREVIDADTGELLTNRDYGGGVMVWSGFHPTKAEARKHNIWARRQRLAFEQQMADQGAAQEERAALEQHRAERDR